MTAHRALLADGPVEGKTVLVAGGAGAVGHYAIELAKYFGARVVTTVSSKEKGEIAAKAGADLVVNYKEATAIDQVKAFAPVMDRIVEVALGANLELDLAVAGPQTSVVTYAADGNDPTIPVRACMSANVNLRFMLLYGVPGPALDGAANDITAAVRQGALTELPVHRFALDDTVAAHEAVESGAVGKVIITPLPVGGPAEADGEHDADRGDEDPQRPHRKAADQPRPDEAADEEPDGEQRHPGPVHRGREGEDDRRDPVGGTGDRVLDGVDPDEGLGQHRAEHGQQQHAPRRAEVSRVHRHREHGGVPEHGPFRAGRGGQALQQGLHDDDHGRPADEHGNHQGERAGRGDQQKRGAGSAPAGGDGGEAQHAVALARQFRAGAEHRPGAVQH
jgi:hypothetical protein